LAFYVASVAAVTGIAMEQDRLSRGISLLDLALLGIATHKLSRIVAKDRITSILRVPFVDCIRSAGAGEVEEEPRGRGIQRGIGQLISCPYCMASWCAQSSVLVLFSRRAWRDSSRDFWPVLQCQIFFIALCLHPISHTIGRSRSAW